MSTALNCLSWMQNQNDQSPCTTAQEVGQLCNAGYTVSLTDFQESNYVPNATTTNDCTCSWSIYNLMSACSYCVGQLQYTSWNTWISDCTPNTSYLPSGLKLSQGIPYWAVTNPSTWENAVFNVDQAADIAAAAHPYVTGGPLPTSTSTVAPSSASRVSVGAIVAGVIGVLALIIAGGVISLCAVRRYRRQRTHAKSVGDPSFNAPQPITVPVPSIRSGNPAKPHLYGPVSRIASPLTSPVSSVFSSHTHGVTRPLSDTADVVSPFLATSSAHRTNPSKTSTSMATGKAAEALSEPPRASAGQRTRLNPPPYSPSVEPVIGESTGAATTPAQNVSTKTEKKRNGSVTSGATIQLGHSRTSTKESVVTLLAGPLVEQSRPRAATPGKVMVKRAESMASAGKSGHRRPPEV
ncbi:hypothetical protein V8E55_001167 [Tylopilus felleus]